MLASASQPPRTTIEIIELGSKNVLRVKGELTIESIVLRSNRTTRTDSFPSAIRYIHPGKVGRWEGFAKVREKHWRSPRKYEKAFPKNEQPMSDAQEIHSEKEFLGHQHPRYGQLIIYEWKQEKRPKRRKLPIDQSIACDHQAAYQNSTRAPSRESLWDLSKEK